MIPIENLSRGGGTSAFRKQPDAKPGTVSRLRRKVWLKRPYSVLLIALCVSLLATACTNSKLLMGPIYNRLDDQIRSEFNKLGDFNAEQEAAFEAAVGTFHVWHRQSEMPQYATLLAEIAQSIATPDRTDAVDMERWTSKVETFAQSARECYPVNFLFGLIRSLSDKQLNAIQRRFINERRLNGERHNSRTVEQRLEHRLKNIDKWAGRADLKLTDSQRALLRTRMDKQISLRNEYYKLSDAWNARLFSLARNQGSPNYHTAMASHMNTLWSLVSSNYPQQWNQNRTLLKDTILDLISSLSADQRKSFSRWLSKLSKTVMAISRDKPSFNIGNDPSIGCLPAGADSNS